MGKAGSGRKERSRLGNIGRGRYAPQTKCHACPDRCILRNVSRVCILILLVQLYGVASCLASQSKGGRRAHMNNAYDLDAAQE